MPQYLAPGVYVEEVPASARPIAGVGTSTAGFIGVAADGVTMPPKPTSGTYTVAAAGTPVQITGWEEFKNNFGDFQSGNLRLAHAVYGFFNNGGTVCWVIRVNADGDMADLTPLLAKFAAIDEIAILAAPGAVTKAQQDALIDSCEALRDRVCILDGQQNPAALTVNDIKGGGPATPAKDSSFAALYYPWIQVFDPVSKANISVPPSGHIAGVYARVDATRGVHKAPANEGIVGALDLDHKLTKAQQGIVNPAGVNVIRAFDGSIKIFGARTLGGDANGDFKYISTRRFFNFVAESIDQGTQFVVFEPNNTSLWQRIIRSVSDFLLGQWRDGALFGETAKQAFFVKCDEQTNPPDVREAGQVITEIGIAIVKPAEFVIFRIQQIAGA